MKNKFSRVLIFSYNVEPNGISGGETILIETFKRIASLFGAVDVYAWKPSHELYTKYGLTNVNYIVSSLPVIPNFYLSFLLRAVYGFYKGITIRLNNDEQNYLYFSSDFLPDAFAVMLLKLRYQKAIFVSNFYLAAPNPFVGFNETGKKRMPTLHGIIFWLTQKPVFYFSKKYADLILVTSEPDVVRFPQQKKKGNYFIVKGGVNLADINKFKKTVKQKKVLYDAVFMGRFHPQKGVVELIEIWKKVTKIKPNAKLIMIGDGQLMPVIKKKIKELKLQKNIALTGYIFDAKKRYTIFSQSRTVVHPAIYDSGGMAATEAMAFGLPGIAFDLAALKTYYPYGMIKVPLDDTQEFANKIIDLLENKNLYRKTQQDALRLIKSEWDWDKRAVILGKKILSLHQ